MHCVTNIHEDLYWLGGSDRQLAKFENVFPIPRGVSYNAYLVLDEKTVLLDTVDKAVGERFFENLEFALAGRPLDYVVVNHMEPDHCATLGELLRRWPGAQVVANAKTVPMVSQFFDCDISNRAVVVKEGDTLCTGRHTFTFLMAPMVHWPEVMVTYDAADKVLFSADAFGTFGALNGNIFADQVDFERDWLDDARRYYTNIVGKYGVQVQAVLKKAATLRRGRRPCGTVRIRAISGSGRGSRCRNASACRRTSPAEQRRRRSFERRRWIRRGRRRRGRGRRRRPSGLLR